MTARISRRSRAGGRQRRRGALAMRCTLRATAAARRGDATETARETSRACQVYKAASVLPADAYPV